MKKTIFLLLCMMLTASCAMAAPQLGQVFPDGTNVIIGQSGWGFLFDSTEGGALALQLLSGETGEAIADLGAKQVDADAQAALVTKATETIRSCFGWDPVVKAGSTDCNVPLSMGIPSVCFGCILGNGMHTREEYIELNSVTNGLQAALKTVMHYEKKSYG